jgi:hypothetical protein
VCSDNFGALFGGELLFAFVVIVPSFADSGRGSVDQWFVPQSLHLGGFMGF